MGFPFSGRGKRRGIADDRDPDYDTARGHGGYFPLYDSPSGGALDDDFRDGRRDAGEGVLYRSGSPGAYDEDDDERARETPRRPRVAVPDHDRPALPWWRPAHWRARRKRWWAVRILAGLLLAFILLVAFLAVTAPLSKSLRPVVPPQITLTAADGTPIARNGADVAAPVRIAALPPHVWEPFLAVEDRRFYRHWGVDPRGIARATWANATGGMAQGGSTITQQLAKFTFLTPERSLTRKAREMLIAFWLEAWLTKDEILERYLSNAYFGDNTYGLRAASLHYFNRRPENLKPEQAMMLAGLVQAPSAYAPSRHWDRAVARMRVVKGAMVAAGYLTPAEAGRMPLPRLDLQRRGDLPTGTYFADWALPEARARAEGGYASQTLRTTLDARLQRIARDAIASAPLGGAQAALVAMRPNGEVVAMVGGTDYARTPFNRATQARRQPGSTFKLFVYLAALQNGARPGDRVANTPIESGSYRPQNAAGHYSPTLSLEDAFARSSNVAALRIFQSVGSRKVIGVARDLGVTSPLPEGDPSLALGTATMTLLELTSAYAAMAADAYPVEATAFSRPEQGWLARLVNGPERFSGRVHSDMARLLRRAVNSGTGRAARLSIPNFGKTGTTQDHRDALFVGYAGDLVVGVWIGNDDNSPLGRISGGGLPARIWKSFMTGAQRLSARPAPRETAPAEAPVEPLDGPTDTGPTNTGPDAILPPGMVADENGVTIQGAQAGVPVDLRIGRDGVTMNGPAVDQARQAADDGRRAVERAAEQLRRDAQPPPGQP